MLAFLFFLSYLSLSLSFPKWCFMTRNQMQYFCYVTCFKNIIFQCLAPRAYFSSSFFPVYFLTLIKYISYYILYHQNMRFSGIGEEEKERNRKHDSPCVSDVIFLSFGKNFHLERISLEIWEIEYEIEYILKGVKIIS